MPTLPDTLKVSIDAVTPYPNNPRRISQAAVDAVKKSMIDYGYTQPIVVDANMVIIAGHTRHAALKQLGRSEVEVIVADGLSPEKVAEYRLVDNRTGEMTNWDVENLVTELREFDELILAEFFPDVDLQVAMLDDMDKVTEDDLRKAKEKVSTLPERPEAATVMLRCPACDYQFEVTEASLFGIMG